MTPYLQESAKPTLRYKRLQSESQVKFQLFDHATKACASGNDSYQHRRKLAMGRSKMGKNRHWKDLAFNMETGSQICDHRKLQNCLQSNQSSINGPRSDKDENHAKAITDRLRRQKEFFKSKLNNDRPSNIRDMIDIQSFQSCGITNCEPRIKHEIISAVRKLRINKIHKEYSLSAELFN